MPVVRMMASTSWAVSRIESRRSGATAGVGDVVEVDVGALLVCAAGVFWSGLPAATATTIATATATAPAAAAGMIHRRRGRGGGMGQPGPGGMPGGTVVGPG